MDGPGVLEAVASLARGAGRAPLSAPGRVPLPVALAGGRHVVWHCGDSVFAVEVRPLQPGQPRSAPRCALTMNGSGGAVTCLAWNPRASGASADFVAGSVAGDLYCASVLTQGELRDGCGKLTVQLNKSGINGGRCNAAAWVPGAATRLLSAHVDGCVYLWESAHASSSAAAADATAFPSLGDSASTCAPGGVSAAHTPARSPNKGAAQARWHVSDAPLTSMAFAPAGDCLAVADASGAVRIYRWRDGTEGGELTPAGGLRAYFGSVRCMCWSPDSRYLAFGGAADLVEVWDAVEQRTCAWGEGHSSWLEGVAFVRSSSEGPEGDRSAGGTPFRVVSVAQDGRVIAWEMSGDASAGDGGARYETGTLLPPPSRRDVPRMVAVAGGKVHAFPCCALAADATSGAVVTVDVSGHVRLLAAAS